MLAAKIYNKQRYLRHNCHTPIMDISSFSVLKPPSLIVPPIVFARVGPGIYRSAYPATKSLHFIDTLHLKSMVALIDKPNDIKKELREYVHTHGITMIECPVGINQEPFVTMSESAVKEAVEFLSNPINHPVMIFCTTGRSKTSVVIGCYRRLRLGWSISSVVHEYEQFMDPDGGVADIAFMENVSE